MYPVSLSPIICLIRLLISLAALFVNVTHSIFDVDIPSSSTRYAYLYVSAFVLPVPAPAIMRTYPSVVVTASFCCSFSSSIKLSIQSSIYSQTYVQYSRLYLSCHYTHGFTPERSSHKKQDSHITCDCPANASTHFIYFDFL